MTVPEENLDQRDRSYAKQTAPETHDTVYKHSKTAVNAHES
jgi:hypothetical protein